jgi:hypothetical protein
LSTEVAAQRKRNAECEKNGPGVRKYKGSERLATGKFAKRTAAPRFRRLIAAGFTLAGAVLLVIG